MPGICKWVCNKLSQISAWANRIKSALSSKIKFAVRSPQFAEIYT